MTTDFGTLATAAGKWDEMAKEFGKVEKRYRDSVQKITLDGAAWQGVSAEAAVMNFAATRYEYQAAQTQAKATATLLRNAHAQFATLKRQLEAARADAIEAGMKVSEQGNVAYDYDRLSPSERSAMRHDPESAASVKASEESWADYIKACVQAVDDADKELKKDLEAVVQDAGIGGRDGTLGGFNGNADNVAKADTEARTSLNALKMRDDETLDDYLRRLQKEGLTRLTGNAKLAELITSLNKGAITAGALLTALTAAGLYSYKLRKALLGTAPTAPGTLISRTVNTRIASAAPGSLLSKVPPKLVTALTGSDEAAMWGGFVKDGKFFMPTASEANLVKVAQQGGLANAAKAAGWIRGAGVVGGVAATAYGVANLATYDTDMIKANPSKFATDLTGTAFSASMTALTVAPNPVTLGLAVGTGVAYAGALVWDNWDSISDGAEKAADWVGDTASDIGSGIADGAKKLGSALNPFD
ncbi:hypothetical protein [Streptomyces sp. TRM64462]|uniref:hypothetical protein n=1 Tax=Streptomyces sp. TRM64462 TaxID=2741726 RepID=UPI0020C7B551|nr:hypothetical protein [Streptomyces sp. TRM64462]